METNTTSVSATAKAFPQRIWAALWQYFSQAEPQDRPSEPQDTVLNVDAAPADCLYRIRRSSHGHTRVVYVHVLSSDFIPVDDRTYGPAIVRRLSDLDEWHQKWKTLTVSGSADALRIDMDKFKPHSLSPEYVHNCYPLHNIEEFPSQSHVKTRIWRCPAPDADAEVYLKLARFQFETRALEREVKAYHSLRGSGLVPAFVGYIYEETPTRVVGFITEQVIGRHPDDATDSAACLAALRSLHEHGVVHGDVNKYNIIITKDGPKFIDFEESILRNEATDWEQRTRREEQSLLAGLSDQSGQGAPWEQ